jgi:ADP-ribose pyrophosphatase YjhB (NUDIX family)
MRKVFNYDNWQESKLMPTDRLSGYKRTVSAAGFLFVNTHSILLINYDNKPLLDDFGGKIDTCDESILDAAIRELREETNGVINAMAVDESIIIDNAKYPISHFYTQEFKYVVFVVAVNDDFYAVNTVNTIDIFDNIEHTNNIPRTIAWHPLNITINQLDSLALRLSKNSKLINYLRGQVLF